MNRPKAGRFACRESLLWTIGLCLLLCGGCQLFVEDADREVYPLIRKRQIEALGIASDVHVGAPEIPGTPRDEAYDFVPSQIDSAVPAAFIEGIPIESTVQSSELDPDAVRQDVEDSAAERGRDAEPADVVDPPQREEDAPQNEQPPEDGDAPNARDLRGGPRVTNDGRSEDALAETRAAHAAPQDAAQDPAAPAAPGMDDSDATQASLEASLKAQDLNVEQMDLGEPMTLSEALAYSVGYARDYQDAKEDLYLRALDLTLERHLWTPQFVSSLSANYTEDAQEEFRSDPNGPDRSMQAVADFAVTQRLPYGGQVEAQWIGTMMRDLENHVTTSEAGSVILSADIPLLRGAGRVAYESRYQAERNLIYQVRTFERFRRQFLTRVANNYFDLLASRTNILNAIASRDSQRRNYLRSKAWADAERISKVDANRAFIPYLNNRNSVIAQVENYQTALDRFKILIGMPVETPIDVVDETLDLLLLEIEEDSAVSIALAMRLDLVTSRDRLEDANRGVEIAKNGMLPDLDLGGQVRWDSNPNRTSAFHYREDIEVWNFGVDLEIPLDRKAERNVLRSSLIFKRRAERDLDLFEDQVRLDVREALRRIRRSRATLEIQAKSVETNQTQREIAKLRFEQGDTDNRDLVDAENDLLDAKNAYSAALSSLRQAILNLKLQTGTLRVSDDGQWSDQ